MVVAAATATGVLKNVGGGGTLGDTAPRTLVLREPALETLGVMFLPFGTVGNGVMATENAIPASVQNGLARKPKVEIKAKGEASSNTARGDPSLSQALVAISSSIPISCLLSDAPQAIRIIELIVAQVSGICRLRARVPLSDQLYSTQILDIVSDHV